MVKFSPSPEPVNFTLEYVGEEKTVVLSGAARQTEISYSDMDDSTEITLVSQDYTTVVKDNVVEAPKTKISKTANIVIEEEELTLKALNDARRYCGAPEDSVVRSSSTKIGEFTVVFRWDEWVS